MKHNLVYHPSPSEPDKYDHAEDPDTRLVLHSLVKRMLALDDVFSSYKTFLDNTLHSESLSLLQALSGILASSEAECLKVIKTILKFICFHLDFLRFCPKFYL
jgi:hypothetical protein